MNLKNRLVKKGISLELTSSAHQYLLENGYDPKNGVRPLRRLIQDTIEDQLALDLLKDSYDRGDIISIGAKHGELTFKQLAETV